LQIISKNLLVLLSSYVLETLTITVFVFRFRRCFCGYLITPDFRFWLRQQIVEVTCGQNNSVPVTTSEMQRNENTSHSLAALLLHSWHDIFIRHRLETHSTIVAIRVLHITHVETK